MQDCGFDYALFAPNIADVDGAHSAGVCVCVCVCVHACVRACVSNNICSHKLHFFPLYSPTYFHKICFEAHHAYNYSKNKFRVFICYVYHTILFKHPHTPTDQTNLTVTKDTMLDCVRMNESTWRKLATEQCVKNGQSHNLDDNTYHNDHVATSDQLKTRVFASLREAVNWCTVDCHGEYYPQNLKDSSIHVQVLVTGSLHLAGAFMSVLDINVDES